jgi:hypothetical protein
MLVEHIPEQLHQSNLDLYYVPKSVHGLNADQHCQSCKVQQWFRNESGSM